MKYTFSFEGQICVIANTEEEAYRLADELIAPTLYTIDNSEDVGIYSIDLIDTNDEESEE